MVQPNPLILSGHETALDEVPSRGITWRDSTTRLLHFRPVYWQCSAGTLPKRLLFTMIKNADVNG
jgi:hypothetical protein